MTDHQNALRPAISRVAEALRLLDGDGDLKNIDSLMVIQFVVEIEKATGRKISPAKIKKEAFASMDAVVSLFDNA